MIEDLLTHLILDTKNLSLKRINITSNSKNLVVEINPFLRAFNNTILLGRFECGGQVGFLILHLNKLFVKCVNLSLIEALFHILAISLLKFAELLSVVSDLTLCLDFEIIEVLDILKLLLLVLDNHLSVFFLRLCEFLECRLLSLCSNRVLLSGILCVVRRGCRRRYESVVILNLLQHIARKTFSVNKSTRCECRLLRLVKCFLDCLLTKKRTRCGCHLVTCGVCRVPRISDVVTSPVHIRGSRIVLSPISIHLAHGVCELRFKECVCRFVTDRIAPSNRCAIEVYCSRGFRRSLCILRKCRCTRSCNVICVAEKSERVRQLVNLLRRCLSGHIRPLFEQFELFCAERTYLLLCIDVLVVVFEVGLHLLLIFVRQFLKLPCTSLSLIDEFAIHLQLLRDIIRLNLVEVSTTLIRAKFILVCTNLRPEKSSFGC